jgi:hypothetical protein
MSVEKLALSMENLTAGKDLIRFTAIGQQWSGTTHWLARGDVVHEWGGTVRAPHDLAVVEGFFERLEERIPAARDAVLDRDSMFMSNYGRPLLPVVCVGQAVRAPLDELYVRWAESLNEGKGTWRMVRLIPHLSYTRGRNEKQANIIALYLVRNELRYVLAPSTPEKTPTTGGESNE